jgi:tRNA(Arg) A34 adenosine deaminase TadA
MKHPNEEIMKRAINLAKEKYKDGGHAVATIIIKNDEIISEAYTTVRKESDPTCHAEMNAIRDTAKKLKSKTLDGCYLYTTYEPCPMCTSAAIWAKMSGIIYGANREDQTKSHPWRVYIPAFEIIKNGTPKLELFSDFMRDECKKLLSLEV